MVSVGVGEIATELRHTVEFTEPGVCPDRPPHCNNSVRVNISRPRGKGSWEAVTISPNRAAYADCVTRLARYSAVLRTEYALADEVVKTKK